MEIWKDIPGYEGRYQASSEGRVRSLTRKVIWKNGGDRVLKGKILLGTLLQIGYYSVYIPVVGNRNRRMTVHRLVAITFINNPDNKPTVNHINGIKTDNRVENLEWCTQSENMQHAYRTGLRLPILGEKVYKAILKEFQVLEIRSRPREKRETLAYEYGVSVKTIDKIRSRTSWKHLKAPVSSVCIGVDG